MLDIFKCRCSVICLKKFFSAVFNIRKAFDGVLL